MTSILRRIELALWLILAAAFWLLADVAAGSPTHAGDSQDAIHGIYTGMGLAIMVTALLFYFISTREGDGDSIVLESVTLKVDTVNVKVIDDEAREARVH